MILIKGGKIVSANSITEADLLIGNDGKIAKIARAISPSGNEVIDATGRFLLPGAIDAHVHLRDPEDASKEDFSTGTASALAGGVTTVMDMPCYRNPPTTSIAAYESKRRLARAKMRCDYILRFGASENNQEEAAKSGAPSLKIFLTDTASELGCTKQAMIEHFASFPKKRPISVHAEDAERIAERKKKYKKHEKIRDVLVAQLACKFVLEEAAKSKRRVHLCHLTTAKEVDMCRKHRNATYEINPAHLYLSASDLPRLKQLGKLNPPLRDKKEQAALWKAIGNDTIIASDHAPHLLEEKKEGASGFPGVGTMLPLMLHAVHEKRLTLQQVARICSQNPAAAFNLQQKGELSAGKDADIVLVDMNKSWKITAENRLSKCGWTPFEGKEVRGKIEKVLLRGKLAYDGENVLSTSGNGKELG